MIEFTYDELLLLQSMAEDRMIRTRGTLQSNRLREPSLRRHQELLDAAYAMYRKLTDELAERGSPPPLPGLSHPNVREWRAGDPMVSERQQHPTR